MKSLKFTHLHDKLVNRKKFRTFRTLNVPRYRIKEMIKIDFEFKKELGWSENRRTTLYVGKITNIYPKRISDVSEQEAREDGFDSLKSFIKGIMEMNNIKFVDHWGFFILWKEFNGKLDSFF